MKVCCFFLLIFFALPALSEETKPALDGYVTRVVSRTDFDVNGFRVICREGENSQKFWESPRQACPQTAPYLGEPAQVFGPVYHKEGKILADKLLLLPALPDKVSGSGVIEVTLPADGGDLRLRADGYWIQVTPKTKMEYGSGLRSRSDIAPALWVKYKGSLRTDGTVTADAVTVSRDALKPSEEQARAKSEYDPASVPATAKQGSWNKVFLGADAHQVPPSEDAAMQAGVQAIGEKLVPAFQRKLAPTDPVQVNFRFQVTGGKPALLYMALPSGIILVSHDLVEHLQNDSQVAAVLADGIATVLEKEDLRLHSSMKRSPASAATSMGLLGSSLAVGSFIPGAGLGWSGWEARNTVVLQQEMNQSSRVSLDLMRDAGYDIEQAPIAWWLLASKHARPLTQIDMPDRTSYLYLILGTVWRTEAHLVSISAAERQ